ncbi:uncharacterized protein VSU04_013197 [Chlamydotis macqueenii]
MDNPSLHQRLRRSGDILSCPACLLFIRYSARYRWLSTEISVMHTDYACLAIAWPSRMLELLRRFDLSAFQLFLTLEIPVCVYFLWIPSHKTEVNSARIVGESLGWE